MVQTRRRPKARRGGSREAIVEAAERLFLERGFGAVSMDELAEAAGVARRTLYNQFASKEEIFREMLLRVSGQLEDAFPPGIETQGDVEDVLRLVARMVIWSSTRTRNISASSAWWWPTRRQFPWIAEEFAAVMDPQTRAPRALSRPSDGAGRSGVPRSDAGGSPVHGDAQRVISVAVDDGPQEHTRLGRKDAVEETIRMFLLHYRRSRPTKRGRGGAA